MAETISTEDLFGTNKAQTISSEDLFGSGDIDGVPKWGRENPNLYGVYGAGKELIKSIPYVKYVDPEERTAFMKKDTQGQTRDLLMETLNAELQLGAGPILKGIGKVTGPVVERFAPKFYEALTKSRGILPKVEAPTVVQKPVEVPITEPIIPESPVKVSTEELFAQPTSKVTPKIKTDIAPAPAEIVQPAATSGGKQPWKSISPDEFIISRDKSTRPEFLTPYTSEELSGMNIKKLPDIDVGYATKSDGDIVNVFNNAEKGKDYGALAVVDAISNGGTKLNAYEGHLTELYSDLGFKEVGREPFNPQYAHPDWAKKHIDNKPDVMYMEYGGIKNDPTYAIRSFEAKRGRVLETQPRGAELSNPQYNEPSATPREGLDRGQSEISPRITPRGTQTSLVNPKRPVFYDALSITTEPETMNLILSDMKSSVEAGRGRAGGLQGQTKDGIDIYAGSGYPSWFSDIVKKYGNAKTSPSGKIESVSAKDFANVLDKGLNGSKLTTRQQGIWEDANRIADSESGKSYAPLVEEFKKAKEVNNETRQQFAEAEINPREIQESSGDLRGSLEAKGYSTQDIESALKELADERAAIQGKGAVQTTMDAMSYEKNFLLDNPTTEISKPLSEQATPKNADMFGNSIIPEVKGGAIGELPKYAEGSAINLERYNSTDDLKQFINERAKSLEQSIGKHKESWDVTRGKAEALGWDVKTIEKEWKRKGSFTAAEIDATRQTNLNAITDLHQAIRDLPYDQTTLPPELRAKVLDAMGLIKVTSQAASEAGRALNIHKRVLSNDPEFRATSEFNRALNAIAGKGAKRTDDLIGRLKDIDFNDPAAVNRFVYDVTKTKWQKLSDGAYELWINGLLSNPLTHIVNTTSNALTLAYTMPERVLATGIETVRSKLTRTPKEMFFGETGQEIFAVSKGLQDGVKRFADAMKKGDLSNKLDYRPTALPEGLSKVLPTRALTAEDAFFKGFIENSELNRLAFRQASKEGLKGEAFKGRITELLANPTEGMLETATGQGKYLTYQKELGAVGNLIFKARDMVPGLKYFIPFVKTPTNIAKFALERSPLYLPIAVSKAIKGELTGAALSEQLAKPLMGTMLGVTVYQLAEQGYITGGQPKQAGERNEKLTTGWQPYSVKVGDTYYSFGRLEPLGSILGMAADMSQIKTQMNEKENFNLAAAIMGSITNNISNKTFMQGFTNMIQGISDPGRYGANIVKSLAGSAIPSVSGGIARAIDTNIRDTRSIADTIQSRIPVAAESLPPKLTVWGEPIERPGTPVGRLLSPMAISKEKGSPIEKEMTRLDLDIGYPSKKIGNVELQPDEYWQMVQQGSQPAKTLLDALSQSSTWKAKSAYQKEHDIKIVVDRYRNVAHKQMVINLVKTGRLKPDNEKEMMYIYNQLK